MFCLHLPSHFLHQVATAALLGQKTTPSASPETWADDEEASRQLDSPLIFPRSRLASGLGAGIGTLSSTTNCLAERLPRLLRASPSTALDELFPEIFQGTRGTIRSEERRVGKECRSRWRREYYEKTQRSRR